ncbi:VOC family protein [Actinoplanes sp. NPDC051346]|uniref:bleomycin resistance protein n=1 Tax=Actinoplanes sp. NPDC051346 TaxID=3155048 RepID=UPI00342391BD
MAGEVTIPLLPCASIDDLADFYRALGFEVTYRQTKPNPYVALRREDLNLHFFGLPDFDPERSYGTCLVQAEDIGALHAAFAKGLRERYGKVLVSGIPRMTRPRPKKNMDGLTGFSVIDPGGNWIRITAKPGSPAAQPGPSAPAVAGRLAAALENAVVQGDNRGDHGQAAKILDGALRRADAADDPAVEVQAVVYRAELALAMNDSRKAAEMLTRARAIELTPAERRRAEAALQTAEELTHSLDAE